MFSKTTGPNSPIIIGKGHTVIFNQYSDVDSDSYQEVGFDVSSLVTLRFDGRDTLVLSEFLLQLEEKGISKDEFSIIVQGTDNISKEKVQLTSNNCKASIDGYVRSLELINLSTKEVIDVGGSNATKEKIAANNVKIILNRASYNELIDTFIPVYNNNHCISESDLRYAVKYNQVLCSIAIAKILGTKTSLEYILSLLSKNYNRQLMKHITESLRNFEELCNKDLESSMKAVMTLIYYIKSNINSNEMILSIVYAIESLGYIGRSSVETKSIAVRFLMGMIKNDTFLSLHRDILWASLVTIERIICGCVKMDIIEGLRKSISSNQRYSEILLNCLEKITQKYHNLSRHNT